MDALEKLLDYFRQGGLGLPRSVFRHEHISWEWHVLLPDIYISQQKISWDVLVSGLQTTFRGADTTTLAPAESGLCDGLAYCCAKRRHSGSTINYILWCAHKPQYAAHTL